MTVPPPGAPPPTDELPGAARVRAQLDALAQAGQLHPCLLFEGVAGLGQQQTALWLARRMNCEAGADERPCGRCWSCRQIAKDQHPDVIRIGLDPERKTPVISVAQARALLSALTLRPYSARQRFVLIEPADALNTESGNALLKTLEEPPAQTVFILITSRPGALLSTVRSRCQRVRFGAPPADEVEAWLRGRGVADPGWMAALAEGSPGRALAFAGEEGAEWREARDAAVAAIAGDLPALFATADRVARSGDRAAGGAAVERTLDALERLLQDALSAHLGRSIRYNPDIAPKVQAWGRALGAPGVARLDRALREARGALTANVSARTALEAVFTRFATELGAARSA
jgi:DNA polymerase-3 subunit delta'